MEVDIPIALTLSDMGSFRLFDHKQKLFYAASFGFIFLFVSIYLILYFFGALTTLPSEANLLKWDAIWYDSIKTYDYSYRWYSASNSAFFPLFPYLWKLLHIGPIGISCFNLFLILISINILYRTFDLHIKYVLIFISLPSSIFFYVPYTESLFFFFCSIFLVGLKKNDLRLIFVGILFASMTRATALFFVPAVIFMEVLHSDKLINKKMLINVALMSFASVLGLFIVVLIQYCQTGEWFAFAKQQNRFWLHKFDLPGFPLVAHGGDRSLWIDGFSFIVGLNAATLAISLIIKKFISKTKSLAFQNKPFLFAVGYIVMITIYGLFFDPKCYDAQTSLNSVNRYVFGNPFFFLFIAFLPQLFSASKTNYALFFLILLFGFYLIGLDGGVLSFFIQEVHGFKMTLLFFCVFCAYINIIYFSINNIFQNNLYMLAFALNTGLSVYCFHCFINGGYVG